MSSQEPIHPDHMDFLLREIHDANLTYLMLARSMLAENYPVARFRLKMSEKTARALMELPAAQVEQLANTGQLLCRFAFTDDDQFNQLLQDKPMPRLGQTHAALLMASEGAAP